MNTKYNANQIANYVINYSIDKGSYVSNLKLQKLLYYIQAAFLVEKNKKCFSEDIVRWRHGPVIPEVYNNFKKYADLEIKEKQTGYMDLKTGDDNKFSFRWEEVSFNSNDISLKDKEIIKKVVDSYSETNPWSMVKKTQEEDPWLLAKSNEIIPTESIYEYYFNKEELIYGE